MTELMRRRRTLMAVGGENLPLSNPPMLYTPDVVGNRLSPGKRQSVIGAGCTDYYPYSKGQKVVYYNPVSPYAGANGYLGHVLLYDASKVQVDWFNCRANGTLGSVTEGSHTCSYITINVTPALEADTYAYNETTGVVYYAGKNTPYYGKTNIND